MRPAEAVGLRGLAHRLQPGEPRFAGGLEAQHAEFVEDDGRLVRAAPGGERRELRGTIVLLPTTWLLQRAIDRLGEIGVAARAQALEQPGDGGLARAGRKRHAVETRDNGSAQFQVSP